jgi:DNA repair photolyase
VERILALAEEAGAAYVGGQALFLRGSVRDVFFDWLRHARPDLVGRYEELYRGRAYLAPREKRSVERVLPGRDESGDPLRFSSRARRERARAARERAGAAAAAVAAAGRRDPGQGALF